MIKLRLYGLFRLDCGVKELLLDVSDSAALMPALYEKLAEMGIEAEKKELKNFILTVNGKAVRGRTRFAEGDEVCLLSAVAGG